MFTQFCTCRFLNGEMPREVAVPRTHEWGMKNNFSAKTLERRLERHS
jgi:hypothetical protein